MGKDEIEFSEQETQERFEAALKGALKTPHQPLKPKREPSKPSPRRGSDQKIDK